MADRKISDLTALTTPASGDYLPIVDISEAAASDKNKRITIEELMRGVPDGTVGAPGIAFESDPNTGIYSPGADQVAVATNGVGRLFVDASGNVGVGTSSPAQKLEIRDGSISVGSSFNSNATNTLIAGYGYILSGTKFGNTSIRSTYSNANNLSSLEFYTSSSATASTERARIDSSGRLLVGTSSARALEPFGISTAGSNTSHVFEGEHVGPALTGIACVSNSDTTAAYGSYLLLGRTRGSAVGSNTIVQAGDNLGTIGFAGADGTDLRTKAAAIYAEVDGTPGANDMPGRLVFSTTADGASSPTERMRITSDAYVRLASGAGGIQFNGDTAAANALDDYEEGTWTPTLDLSTTQFTAVNYNTWTKGHYRKIGSLVHVQGVLITNDINAGSGAGTVRIGGLPFASPANISGENYTGTSSISVGFADAWTSVQPSSAEVATNSTRIALYAEDATGERTALTTENVTDANFSNIIRFAGTYISV